jgi:hypothetical protein
MSCPNTVLTAFVKKNERISVLESVPLKYQVVKNRRVVDLVDHRVVGMNPLIGSDRDYFLAAYVATKTRHNVHGEPMLHARRPMNRNVGVQLCLVVCFRGHDLEDKNVENMKHSPVVALVRVLNLDKSHDLAVCIT